MAFESFLEIKEIPGESQKKGHEDQMDVLSYQLGVVQTGSFQTGGPGGGAGKAEFHDISIVKYVDKATAKLFEACAAGTHFGKATLTVRKAGDKPLEYLKIEMQDLMISSQTINGASGNDQVVESITMNAAVIKQNYIEQDAKGGAGKTVAAGFDIRAGEKVA